MARLIQRAGDEPKRKEEGPGGIVPGLLLAVAASLPVSLTGTLGWRGQKSGIN